MLRRRRIGLQTQWPPIEPVAKSAASTCQAARGACQKRREHLPSSSRCLPKPRHPIKATAFPEGKPASHPRSAWRGRLGFFFHLPDGHSTGRAFCSWSSRRSGTPRQDRSHPSSHPERARRGGGSIPSRPVTYRRIRSDLSRLRDTPRRGPRPPPEALGEPRRTWMLPAADPRMTLSDSPGGILGAWSLRDDRSDGAPGALSPPDKSVRTPRGASSLRSRSAATSPGSRVPRRRFCGHLSRHFFGDVGLKGAHRGHPAARRARSLMDLQTDFPQRKKIKSALDVEFPALRRTRPGLLFTPSGSHPWGADWRTPPFPKSWRTLA
jgi:hypothetical protein